MTRSGLPADPDGAEQAAERANTLLRLGRPAEALREATLGLASHPHQLVLLQVAAIAHAQLKQYREALRLAETLLQVSPDWDLAHRRYAAYRWDGGRRDARAVAAARQAVALRPQGAENHTLLAFMLMARGRVLEAHEHLTEALSLHPGDDSAAEAHSLLGELALRQRRPDVAEREAQAALAVAPEHNRAIRVLATAQLRTHQPHEAIRTALNAVRQHPSDPARARYLRTIVLQHLPSPWGLQRLALIGLPYGAGLVWGGGSAIWTLVANARRLRALPPDLRDVVDSVRHSATLSGQWREALAAQPSEVRRRWRQFVWFWLGYVALFVAVIWGLAGKVDEQVLTDVTYALVVVAALASTWMILRMRRR